MKRKLRRIPKEVLEGRNEERLILTISQHATVSRVGEREDVRSHLLSTLALVVLDNLGGINGKPLVRIHGDQEKTRIGLFVCVKGGEGDNVSTRDGDTARQKIGPKRKERMGLEGNGKNR